MVICGHFGIWTQKSSILGCMGRATEGRKLDNLLRAREEIMISWHLDTGLAADLLAWHHPCTPNVEILTPASLLSCFMGDLGYQNVDILVALAP